MKKLLLLSIVIALFITEIMPTLAQQSSSKKHLENYLENEMKIQHIPGLSYSVIKDGKVLNIGSLGTANLSWHQKVTVDTRFQIASVSKLFCGVLLARLMDKKIISAADSLGKLIADIPDQWKSITIKQLASHQSGIALVKFPVNSSTQEGFNMAKNAKIDFLPGTNSSYMSSDFWILQYLIEKMTGMDYYSALKSNVLDPLEMKYTSVNHVHDGMARTTDVIRNEATVYHFDKSSEAFRNGDFPFPAWGYAAGGLFTSISDFTKLVVALDKGTFISPASYRLLVEPQRFKNSSVSHYGMGTIVRTYENRKLVEHSGGPALADFSRFEDEKLTIIVLTNQRGVFPYLAKSIGSFYIKGMPKQEIPKDYKF